MHPIRIMFTLLIGLYFSQVMARETWYHVEVIVFQQNTSITTVREELPENTILPDPSQGIALNYGGEGGGYKLLPESSFIMKNQYRQLGASSVYQPIAHLAWRQPIKFGRSGNKVGIKAGRTLSKQLKIAPPEAKNEDGSHSQRQPSANAATITTSQSVHEIQGVLNLSRQKFVHFDVDLVYHKQTSSGVHSYRLQDIRRLKSKEVNFMDHPMFGMLVYVVPLNTGGTKTQGE